jgi:hypothetical protein
VILTDPIVQCRIPTTQTERSLRSSLKRIDQTREHLRCVILTGMKLEATLWILLLLSAAVAFALPKYRAYCLMVAGAVLLSIVAVLVLTKRDEHAKSAPAHAPTASSAVQPQPVDFERLHMENMDKKDPDAKNRIGLAELRFDQLRPEFGSQPGTIRLIHARLYNDAARYTLTDYAYYLAVQDCASSVCTTVYDQRGLGAVSVPPGQARDVIVAIREGEQRGVPTFRILGTPNIKLTPTETRAYGPPVGTN